MDHEIFDKEGHTYIISVQENDEQVVVKLYDHRTLVGEANCVRESPDTLFLGDILIHDSVIPSPNNPYIALLRKLLGYQPKPVNYRNKRLGSALLKHLIAYAQKSSVHHFYGKVHQKDLNNNWNLIDWYRLHGFDIKSPNSNDRQGVVASVHLDIASLLPTEKQIRRASEIEGKGRYNIGK